MLAAHLPQPWVRLAERRIGYALGLRNRSPGGMKYNPGNNPGIHCHIQGDASLLPGFDFLINKWGCNPPNNMRYAEGMSLASVTRPTELVMAAVASVPLALRRRQRHQTTSAPTGRPRRW